MRPINKLLATTIGGCLTLVAFGYLSYKAYPRIEEIRNELNNTNSVVKKVKMVAPIIAPPATAGLCSLGFQILGCKIATNAIKSLSALASLGVVRGLNMCESQNGKYVYYDVMTDEEFTINEADFLKAIYDTQVKLITDNSVTMNYWRQRVGLPTTRYGDMHGWNMWYYWENGSYPVINISAKTCLTDRNVEIRPVYFGKDLVNLDLIKYGEEETSK